MRNFRSPSLSSFACKGKLFPRNVQIIGQKNGVKVLIMCPENLHSHHSIQHKDTKTRRLRRGIEDTKLAYGGLSLLWLLWLLGSVKFFISMEKTPPILPEGEGPLLNPPLKGRTSPSPKGDGKRWRSFSSLSHLQMSILMGSCF